MWVVSGEKCVIRQPFSLGGWRVAGDGMIGVDGVGKDGGMIGTRGLAARFSLPLAVISQVVLWVIGGRVAYELLYRAFVVVNTTIVASRRTDI